MQKLFQSGRRYLKAMGLVDIAALKVCLLSLGFLIGLFVPSKHKKSLSLLGGILFAGTYVLLMSRFFSVIRDNNEN